MEGRSLQEAISDQRQAEEALSDLQVARNPGGLGRGDCLWAAECPAASATGRLLTDAFLLSHFARGYDLSEYPNKP